MRVEVDNLNGDIFELEPDAKVKFTLPSGETVTVHCKDGWLMACGSTHIVANYTMRDKRTDYSTIKIGDGS